jgi:hypothetical protein
MRINSINHVLRLAVVAALAAAVLLVVPAGSASAAGVPCRRTLADLTAPLAIKNDGSPTFGFIDVPEDGLVVTDIDVSLDLHYPDPSDLHIELQNWPDDESLIRSNTILYDREQGITGANMLGTVFDDEARTPVSWGNAPYTGRFMPKRPLAEVEGQTGGKYVLIVAKPEPESGTLDTWSITLTYQTCDFDADGVEDHADKCLGLAAHTATGCPLTTRAVTSTYRLGRFKGALSSPVAACKAARPVTVWKVRSGADRLIGTATTRSDGGYKLVRAKRAGRYYATSPRVAVVGIAECPAVQSATFRIR